MRERLIQYVELLFAGAPGAEDIKQEILQNTLDRFDDLVAQGKTEEAAYRLAISGIGDINEILDVPAPEASAAPQEEAVPIQARRLRAASIAMYITCAIPLFILSEFGLETIGLCLTLLMVAAATYILLLSRQREQTAPNAKPVDPKRRSLDKIINAVALVIYLLISFTTQAWFITWLVFPIDGCIKGLVSAITDLKEEITYEN